MIAASARLVLRRKIQRALLFDRAVTTSEDIQGVNLSHRPFSYPIRGGNVVFHTNPKTRHDKEFMRLKIKGNDDSIRPSCLLV